MNSQSQETESTAHSMGRSLGSRSTLHGNLTRDPILSIERTVTILGKRIQVQHITLGTIAAALTIGSLLLKEEKEHEDATRSD